MDVDEKYDSDSSDNIDVEDKTVWLLIRGCTKTRGSYDISKKVGRDYSSSKWSNGSYLGGMKVDINRMEKWINDNDEDNYWYNTLVDNQGLTIKKVLKSIIETAVSAMENNADTLGIYYTGHGETKTGNWCFSDGVLKFDAIMYALTLVNKEWKDEIDVKIASDCCYSGNWCIESCKYIDKLYDSRVEILAASWPGKKAYDDSKEGGYWTSSVFGGRYKDNLKWCMSVCEYGSSNIKYIGL